MPTLTKAFAESYAMLNKEQKRAVDTIEGPVMVVAGPGTGKTQILTLRIANILKETQANPEDILALTFTNSGVRAMRDRLRRYIGDDAYRVGIYTFHSFAEHVLQSYSNYFPAFADRQVVSDVDKAKLLEEILSSQKFEKIVSTYDQFSSLRRVMDAIDTIKQEGYTPEAFEAKIPAWEKGQLESDDMFYKVSRGKFKAGDVKPTEKKKVEGRVLAAREVGTVFKAYQRELEKSKRYDFSDMILNVLKGLGEDQELKADLQERYQYVLVDEHQDTNDGQNSLVEHLTDAPHLDGRPNLFTVGDEKQSIYRFQGASDKAFKHFKEHYNDVVVIELERNYRSGSEILAASHEMITNSLSDAKALESQTGTKLPVEVREFSDYKFELLHVVNDIEKKIKAGVSPDEIAIIYRANKHLEEIKGLFQDRQIPYHVLSRDTLLDDPRITMLIHLIRVINDPSNNNSVGKALFADFLAYDALEVASVLQEWRSRTRGGETKKTLIEYLRSHQTFSVFVEFVTDLVTFDKNHTFVETFKEVLQKSGYLSTILRSPDSRAALRKVEVLFNELRQQAEGRSYTAANFVNFVDATMAYGLAIDVIDTKVGAGVQCMTAHGSKGLEFQHVYMINTASSNWEKRRAFASIALPIEKYAGDVDDERRLFYVGLTRAKEELQISSSKQDWSGRALEPSRFIAELGDESVEVISTDAFEAAAEPELHQLLMSSKIIDSVFNVAYLKARFFEENLSVTALNNYIECPLKYLFRNLIQLPDVYTPALRYGDAVHRALEAFFLQSLEAEKVLDRDTLLSCFDDTVASASFTEADYEKFKLKGRQSLGMYYDYYHQDWTLSVSLEEYIRRSLSLGDVTLTISGKIDKIEYHEAVGHGPMTIIDYKTGKVFSKKTTKAQKDALRRQIQFYHLLLEDYKDGDVTISEAKLDFVEPTEDNEFEQTSLPVTEADLEALRSEIGAMIAAIESGAFLQSGCNKKDCDACQLWSSIHAAK